MAESAMKTLTVHPLSDWLQQEGSPVGYLLLSLNNSKQLEDAYGFDGCWQAVASAFVERLMPYGIRDNDILALEHVVLVRLNDASLIAKDNQDEVLEHIEAKLSFEPVLCGAHRVLVNVSAAWIESVAGALAQPPVFSSDLYTATRSRAFAEADSYEPAQIRRDMDLAVRFFDLMRAARIVLAFQPVVSIANDRWPLYYEALLRTSVGQAGELNVSCGSAVQALERLNIIQRLDASVLQMVLQELEQHPDLHLACNISPLSLQQSRWWGSILSVLGDTPALANRLTLEITETAAIFDMDAAIRLLESLRSVGCKIAIDDVGVEHSTLHLAEQLTPDFIKIDKTLVHAGRTQGGSRLLRSWVEASRRVSQYVIAEGVESENDLQLSIDAGVHAAQGHLIEPPSIQPLWRAEPVWVQDSFSPAHRSVAINQFS